MKNQILNQKRLNENFKRLLGFGLVAAMVTLTSCSHAPATAPALSQEDQAEQARMLRREQHLMLFGNRRQ